MSSCRADPVAISFCHASARSESSFPRLSSASPRDPGWHTSLTVSFVPRDPISPQSKASPPRLIDQVRAAIRLRHYSPRTEEAYVSWLRRFIVFHGKRHPREMARRK